MYNSIKQLIRRLIPRQTLYRLEPTFRAILSLFYLGNKVECNLCNGHFRKFVVLEDEDELCPKCGSLPRTRRLWELLSTRYLKDGVSILDFSPSRSLYRVMNDQTNIHYAGTDISGDFLSDFHFDITNIDAPDANWDVIICYHILEHIDNDLVAMQELHRVLKNGGVCLIQTPFKSGDTYENPSVISESERLIHFGQEDHVRIYSVAGLQERLQKVGFKVDVLSFPDVEKSRLGYNTNETVLICTK